MTIEAKVIADSVSPEGIRLTTFQLRYPRFIHAEFMTHRLFSRNASSSRAIPVAKMIEDLRRDPAMPVFWGSNQKGMQAGIELDDGDQKLCEDAWLLAMHENIRIAELMMTYGLHKQIANRILEPWAHINVVCTATDYENFYALRRHKDAQPEIKALADAMWDAQKTSIPNLMQPGDWHLPYINANDRSNIAEYTNWGNPHTADHLYFDYLKRVSVARCARVSYLTHDGRQTTVEEDLALYERLVGGMPLHASPAEHQATPDYHVAIRGHDAAGNDITMGQRYKHEHEHGNLRGWRQLRKMLPGEFTAG